MKPPRKVIHIVRHKPTGANVPIEINKVDDNNVVQDYRESLTRRKGYTLQMLQDRWNKSRDECLELLQAYQVPGHLNHVEVLKIGADKLPADIALFFSEYIYAVERKAKITHSKLKPIYVHEENKH